MLKNRSKEEKDKGPRTEEIPKMRRILAALEPMIFPKKTSANPLRVALIVTNNSGSAVPKATRVMEISFPDKPSSTLRVSTEEIR